MRLDFAFTNMTLEFVLACADAHARRGRERERDKQKPNLYNRTLPDQFEHKNNPTKSQIAPRPFSKKLREL